MNIATFFGGLATVIWVVFLLVLSLVVTRASRNKPMRSGSLLVLAIGVLALAVSTVSSGLVFITPEQRGIVISALQPKGYREEAIEPGLRWVIPFFESVVTYPISRQTYTMSIAPNEGAVKGDDSITARTSDGQEVLIDASVIFAIDPNKIINIHIFWKNTYTDNLIRPQTRGVIRDVIAQYNVQDVVSAKRVEMTEKVRVQLEKKLADNGLILIDYILRNITFSKEYAASVEQKQIAEQQAQQAKLVVESKKQEAEQARQVAQGLADAAVIRSKGEAEARLINADAEAKSLELIAKALKDKPELLTYQYVIKLAPNTQVMLLPSNAPVLLNLPGLQNIPTPTATPSPTPVPTPKP